MNSSYWSIHVRHVARAFLGLTTAVALTVGCGPTRSNAPASRTGGTMAAESDGGLPVAPSTRQGVITPGDTGLGATPSGSASTTGTSGSSVGRSLGNTNGGSGN